LSDITKKIFSIEPGIEPETDDVLRPVSVKPAQEDVPTFVTREAKTPIILPATPELEEVRSGWIMWTGLAFTLLWLVGAGLMFAGQITGSDAGLLEMTGFILLLALPAMLITLLWAALRKLVNVTNRNAQLAQAAQALVNPETEALGRTQTLAAGIRAEISKVNGQLADTVTALQGVQTAITRESQALDAAGLQLTSRSEDVGRNLTLQRQALESISGTFDAKMETLSAQIEETGKGLETSSETARERLEAVTSSMTDATTGLSTASQSTDEILKARVTELGEISRKIDGVSEALKADLTTSAKELSLMKTGLSDRVEALNTANTQTYEKLAELKETLAAGQDMLRDLEAAASTRSTDVRKLYETLSEQLKQSEDNTLTSQGRTARMVEGNLAQMRREFGRMETDLQTLQTKLNNLRETSEELPLSPPPGSRLSLRPLETDFPPVEPPRKAPALRPAFKLDAPRPDVATDVLPDDQPLNLGADMQLETPDTEITNFDPDVLRRPGDIQAPKSGFGRSKNKEKTSGWHWRDMLGGLERPDAEPETVSPEPRKETQAPIASSAPKDSINILERLDAIQLSPAAIVDDGTIIDATQARINRGEAGLAEVVAARLSDPIAHLQSKMNEDAGLASNVAQFASDFAERVGATPPTAPALRTVFGSPNGRAYLLCAGALKR